MNSPTRPNTVAGRRRSAGHLFVVDQEFRITTGELHKPHRNGSTQSYSNVLEKTHQLAPEIEATVRKLTASWNEDSYSRSQEIGLAEPSLIVRVFPLQSEDRWCIGVYVEPYLRRPTLAERAEALEMSPTEYEIVRLLFEGLTEAQVAEILSVPEARLHDSILALQRKIHVESYDELVAKLAGTVARKSPR